ncbi:MAG: hypothetical protein J6N19_09805 [Clostridium sp.]|nr:hypothetical protein [Clostridium sp.]
MKGRIIDFSMSFGGKQRITLELDTDFREGYEALKESVVEISIKKWRRRRSNDANKYFHVLVNEIAAARGISDEEVKRDLIVDYGTIARDDHGDKIGFKLPASVDVDDIYPYTRMYKEVEENGKSFKCYLVYKRSSDMDTKEMAHLIDGAITVAQELNIDTDTPERASWWESLKGET